MEKNWEQKNVGKEYIFWTIRMNCDDVKFYKIDINQNEAGLLLTMRVGEKTFLLIFCANTFWEDFN